MAEREKSRLGTAIISTASVAAVVLVWQGSVQLGLANPLLLPAPTTVAATAGELIRNGYGTASLAQHVAVSLARALGAFLVASLVGIPLGLGMGMNPTLDAIVNPFIQFFRPLPKLALIPLAVLWFGIGEVSKFVLIFLSTFLTIVVGAAGAVGGIRQQRIKAARALGASGMPLFWRVILPSVLPEVFLSIRLGVGIGWTTLIAAEMIASERGLGWMITNAAGYLRTDIVMLGIVLLGSIGYLLDVALQLLQRQAVPWAGRE